MEWSRLFQLFLSPFQRIPSRRLVILVVMAVVLYQLTGILYQTITLQLVRMRPSPIEGPAPAAAAPLKEPAADYQIIPERNLFHTTTRATAAPIRPVDPSPQQDLALLFDLKGTVAGSTKHGFAVVEDRKTRKQRLVKVGDFITGAKVVAIRWNAVDLSINGRESTLELRETKKEAVPTPARATPAVAASSNTTVVSRGMLQDAMANMGRILSQAQIRPYFNAGVPDGFIVNMLQPGSIYQKMGIARGDIIQEVNGRKIRTIDDVMGLLNTIRSGSSLSLGIKRQGRSEVLNYEFQ